MRNCVARSCTHSNTARVRGHYTERQETKRNTHSIATFVFLLGSNIYHFWVNVVRSRLPTTSAVYRVLTIFVLHAMPAVRHKARTTVLASWGKTTGERSMRILCSTAVSPRKQQKTMITRIPRQFWESVSGILSPWVATRGIYSLNVTCLAGVPLRSDRRHLFWFSKHLTLTGFYYYSVVCNMFLARASARVLDPLLWGIRPPTAWKNSSFILQLMGVCTSFPHYTRIRTTLFLWDVRAPASRKYFIKRS